MAAEYNFGDVFAQALMNMNNQRINMWRTEQDMANAEQEKLWRAKMHQDEMDRYKENRDYQINRDAIIDERARKQDEINAAANLRAEQMLNLQKKEALDRLREKYMAFSPEEFGKTPYFSGIKGKDVATLEKELGNQDLWDDEQYKNQIFLDKDNVTTLRQSWSDKREQENADRNYLLQKATFNLQNEMKRAEQERKNTKTWVKVDKNTGKVLEEFVGTPDTVKSYLNASDPATRQYNNTQVNFMPADDYLKFAKFNTTGGQQKTAQEIIAKSDEALSNPIATALFGFKTSTGFDKTDYSQPFGYTPEMLDNFARAFSVSNPAAYTKPSDLASPPPTEGNSGERRYAIWEADKARWDKQIAANTSHFVNFVEGVGSPLYDAYQLAIKQGNKDILQKSGIQLATIAKELKAMKELAYKGYMKVDAPTMSKANDILSIANAQFAKYRDLLMKNDLQNQAKSKQH